MVTDMILLLGKVLSFFNFLFAFTVIITERKNPATTWTWLIVILFVPYVGFVIYLLLGYDSRKYWVFMQKTREDERLLNTYENRGVPTDTDGRNPYKKTFWKQERNLLQTKEPKATRQTEYIRQKTIFKKENADHINDMLYLNLVAGNGNFYENNRLEIFHDGVTKFETLLKDIAAAEKFILMQYYIVRDDELGRQIIAALAEKAAQGVEVRFLVDGMGCAGVKKSFYRPLLEQGGKTAVFMPPHFIRINFRNHRKIAVIDGRIGYIGGLNIGDEYVGKVRRFGFWRDCHLRICGDAVYPLTLRFMMDWNFCYRDKPGSFDQPRRQFMARKVSNETFLNVSKDGLYFPPIPKINRGIPMQIVSSGPDTKWPSIQHAYVKMIAEADKNIFIQTPYFVPEDSLLEALRVAALSGIDVRIMIPGRPDHPFVYWAALSYLGELMEAGVKCYQYEKGFVHSKYITVDGLFSSVGTANMDVRSFKLNFEINAFIYDQAVTHTLETQFLLDIRDSMEINREWYDKRSGMTKVKESFSRLLSPLL